MDELKLFADSGAVATRLRMHAPDLLREFRAIDFVNRLMDENRLDPQRYRRNRMHRIDAMKALANYGPASKLDTSWRFFRELHAAGRKAAAAWLAANFDAIGVRATLGLRAEFM